MIFLTIPYRDETAESYIQHQGDALVLRNARFVWVMHVLTASLMGYLLLRHTPHPELLISVWVAWMIILGISQGVIAFLGLKTLQRDGSVSQIITGFDLVTVALAAGYGFLAFILVPTTDPNLDQFVGFIITGGVLTGTGSFNLRYRTLTLNITMIMTLLAARSFLENPDGRGVILAGMLMIFLVLMLLLGRFLRNTTRNGFRLQWEKLQLARQLAGQAEELKLARAEADAANEAKSRFLAQASHDLRQPLHSMGLFLASLRHEKLSTRADDIVDRLNQSVDVLSELFSTLLDVTLMDTQEVEVNPRPVLVRQIFEDVVSEFQPVSPEHSFEIRCEADLCLRADPLVLRRLIQNLVSNAVRHTKCGVITLIGSEAEGQVELSVSDSGDGIPEQDQKRIFIEFERGLPVGNATRGLGLGLSIVHRLAQLSGGQVTLTSRVGAGSCFSVGPFPVSEQSAGTTEEAVPVESSAVSGQRVLIVDDDRPTLEATATILSRWGWEIDARESVMASDLADMPEPDLVVTDFDLSEDVTGIDLIALLRTQFDELPALIISGSSTEQTRILVREAGFMLLHKPVRPAQLRSALIALMG